MDAYPDYFSECTYWNSEKFWHFVGVPFEAVTAAISEVAVEFRDRLKKGLRGLLPEDEKGHQSP